MARTQSTLQNGTQAPSFLILPPYAGRPSRTKSRTSSKKTVSARSGCELETGQTVRVKRFHSKSRRGCYTCRQRRVKCDEQRNPDCARCDKGGYNCEWQDSRQNSSEEKYSIRATRSPSQTTNQSDNNDLMQHEFFFDGTVTPVAELFIEMAVSFILDPTMAQQVSDKLSHFYHQIVFQASHTSPVIHKALTALHELYNCVHLSPGTIPPCTDYISTYGEAVTDLRHNTQKMSPDIVLISCVLFANCEYFLGDLCSAVRHIQAGSNILQEHQSRSNTLLTLEIQETLGPIFRAFNHSSIRSHTNLERQDYFATALNMFFSDLKEASNGLIQIYQHIFAMRNVIKRHHKHTSTAQPDLIRWLDSWLTKMVDLEMRIPLEHHIWFELLVLQYRALSISTNSFRLFEKRTLHSTLEMDELMLSMSAVTTLLPATTAKTSEWNRHIGGHVGILLPLFTIIQHCLDLPICQSTLETLRQLNITESVWNNCIAYEVANFILKARIDVRMHTIPLGNFLGEPLPAVEIASISTYPSGQAIGIRLRFVNREYFGGVDTRDAVLTQFCSYNASDARRLQEVLFGEGYQGLTMPHSRASCVCHE